MTDLRNQPREPFGPRQPGLAGGVLRLCQWGLAIITCICLWPGVMMSLSVVLDFLPKEGSWRMPPTSTLLIDGTWCLWGLLLMLTALRLSGYSYRWWGFYPNVLAYSALASQTFPDASDPVGQCIAWLMSAVVVALCLLHGLWSLSERLLRRYGDQQGGKGT